MSVNIDLNFTIRGFKPERSGILRDAAHRFLVEEEGLGAFGLSVYVVDDGNCIQGRTGWPAIISRSYDWLPRVEEEWRALAERFNEGPCDARLDSRYADDG